MYHYKVVNKLDKKDIPLDSSRMGDFKGWKDEYTAIRIGEESKKENRLGDKYKVETFRKITDIRILLGGWFAETVNNFVTMVELTPSSSHQKGTKNKKDPTAYHNIKLIKSGYIVKVQHFWDTRIEIYMTPSQTKVGVIILEIEKGKHYINIQEGSIINIFRVIKHLMKGVDLDSMIKEKEKQERNYQEDPMGNISDYI